MHPSRVLSLPPRPSHPATCALPSPPPQASLIDPKLPLPRYGLAQMSVLQGQTINAVSALEAVLEEEPGWYDALRVRGMPEGHRQGRGALWVGPRGRRELRKIVWTVEIPRGNWGTWAAAWHACKQTRRQRSRNSAISTLPPLIA